MVIFILSSTYDWKQLSNQNLLDWLCPYLSVGVWLAKQISSSASRNLASLLQDKQVVARRFYQIVQG